MLRCKRQENTAGVRVIRANYRSRPEGNLLVSAHALFVTQCELIENSVIHYAEHRFYMSDIYQFIDDLDSDKQSMVAKRLEDCAQMPQFAEIRKNYFDKVGLPSEGSIHELGCGTGAVCRAIASRPGFNGTVSGSDLSASLIDTAKEIAANTDLKNIHYYQSDGQGGGHQESQHDVVLAHTVISQVPEPEALLAEAIRLARPGGRIIVHDGDFASMTFSTGAQELDIKMPDLILQSAVANRYIMRELPRDFR